MNSMRIPILRCFCLIPLAAPLIAAAAEQRYFAIHVVDDQTGRGVPLVELKTTNELLFVTDSNGFAAIDEPAFVGRKVYFNIKSHGYEYPADGFGYRGKAIEVKPGGAEVIRIKRLNIAERLYRTTGEGIYRDSILLGEKTSIAQPAINALVVGQDSIQSIVYQGKILWMWGDTGRLTYPLGHFGMAGATSKLPEKGGLDPSVGINLEYFTGRDGFSRPMVEDNRPGLKWMDGLMLLKDEKGIERIVAHCNRMKSLHEMYDHGLVIYDDAAAVFRPLLNWPNENNIHPNNHPVLHEGHYYFPDPLPNLRVRAELESVKRPEAYEAFTCLKSGGDEVDRDDAGRVVWAWKKNALPMTDRAQQALIKAGKLKPEDAWLGIKDVEGGNPVRPHRSSVAWNDFRRKWIMIVCEIGGKPSNLGEIWYAEADRLEGPWATARKIVTHDRYSFYNPKHHPFLDQQAGRMIYFEGTYTAQFSREHEKTPRYDYNQIMYRLDLSDPRLRLPDPKGPAADQRQ